MRAKHKIDEQRHSPRITAAAMVTIDEHKYIAEDWSIGGFRLNGFNQEAKVGDCLPVQFSLKFRGGINISTDTLVEIVWMSGKKSQLGFRFLNLTKVEQELLQQAINNLQIGEITPLEELTKKSGKPVEAASASSSQNKGSKLPFEKRNYKIIFYSSGGLVIGGLLLLFTGSSLYRSLISMEIKSAVLSNPIEPITSNNTGTLSQVSVREGMKVEAGQPLFWINDEEIARSISQDEVSNINTLIRNKLENVDALNQKIQISRLELAEAQFALQNANNLKQQEIEKLQPSKAVAQNQLEAALSKVNSLTMQHEVAKNNLDRFSQLYQAGAVSQQRVDSARAELAKLDGNLQEAKAEFKIAQTAIVSVQNGNFYDGDSFVGELPRLKVEVKEAEQRVQIAAKKLAFLEQAPKQQEQEIQKLEKQKQTIQKPKQGLEKNIEPTRSSIVYNAPVSGSVLKVTKSTGNKVNDGEALVLLQPKLAQPTVEAYLTQDQVAQVAIGSKATVLIPDLNNKSYQAQVLKIDRTGGLPDEVRGQYQFQGSQEQPAYVKLELLGITPEEKSKLTGGMPVRLKITKTRAISF